MNTAADHSQSPCQGSHPLSASFYADSAGQYATEIVENVPLARDTYRVRFYCPPLARQIRPGQFLMLRLAGCDDPVLGRPFALYDTVLDSAGEPVGVDVVYLVVGKMTGRLAECGPGTKIEVWGPLGNGFSLAPVGHLVMVGGGIGQTPFLALGRAMLGGRSYGTPSQGVPQEAIEPQATQTAQRVTVCYGVRSAEFLAGVDDFEQAGIEVQTSSDDGSVGYHGFVTDLLEKLLTNEAPQECRVACCGPEPMMQAAAEIAARHGAPCEVSLETPMACGLGICFSCVVRIAQQDGTWDYKRTCVEGPVFDAEKVVW